MLFRVILGLLVLAEEFSQISSLIHIRRNISQSIQHDEMAELIYWFLTGAVI